MERKLARDAAVADTLLAEGFRPEDLACAVEWAVEHIPRVTSFGPIPSIMHQALQAQAWEALAREGEGPHTCGR